jgi:hypothetical protein
MAITTGAGIPFHVVAGFALGLVVAKSPDTAMGQ